MPETPKGNGHSAAPVIESADFKDYWLHVLASRASKLSKLDQLLRETWLECCGHLSSFEIAGESFDSSPYDGGWDGPSRSMNLSIGSVLGKGSKFKYEYDFGSTTRLVGRCVGTAEGVPTRPSLSLVSRNLMPAVPCAQCGEPAAWLGDVATCVACTGGEDEDEWGERGLLPVVNSPRMGVCDYEGSLSV